MAKRQVFFSFHYFRDNWRAAQVKNMGVVDNSSTWSANDWEEVRYKTDENGEILISSLPLGVYEVKEIEALPNYILNEEVKIFELK